MDLGTLGEGIDRLEADAEAADRGRGLRALIDATDRPHVRLVERSAPVGDAELGRREVEAHVALPAPSGRVEAEGVLRILQQLEDEVRAVVVAVGEEHAPDAPDVRTVAALVVGANVGVVRSHGWNAVEG